MPVETGGTPPGAEEVGAAAGQGSPEEPVPSRPAESIQPQPPAAPPKVKRRWWPWSRGAEQPQQKETSPADELRRTAEELRQTAAEIDSIEKAAAALERGDIQELTPEKFTELSKTPEGIAKIVTLIGAEEYVRMRMRELHGKGRGARWKEYFSGDIELKMDENNPDFVERDSRKELIRRGKGILLKSAPGAALLVAGLFTAGATLPALWAYVGGVGGSAFAEGAEMWRGKGGRLREQIARLFYQDWKEMRINAQKYQEAPTEEEKYTHLKAIIDQFHSSSEAAKKLHSDFLGDRKRWDRIKTISTLIGSAAGLTAGSWQGLKNLWEAAHRLDLDSNGIWHRVRKIGDVWHFLYNQGEKMASGATAVGGEAHIVGNTFGHNVGREIAQRFGADAAKFVSEGVGVFFANAATAVVQGRVRRGEQKEFEEEQMRIEQIHQREKDLLGAQMPEQPRPAAETGGGGGGGGVRGEGGEQGASTSEKYRNLAERLKVDQIWLIDAGNGEFKFVQIKNIDWATGKVILDYLGHRKPIIGGGFEVLEAGVTFDIEELIRKGKTREEYGQDWARALKNGDTIVIPEGTKIANQYDPRKDDVVPEGEHRFRRIGDKDSQDAELIDKDGNRRRVTLFDLFFGRAGLKESKPEAADRLENILVGQTWYLKDGVDATQLPERIARIATNGLRISSIEYGIIRTRGLDEDGNFLKGDLRQSREISLSDLRQYFRMGEPAESGGGGQQRQGGGQRRQRQQ